MLGYALLDNLHFAAIFELRQCGYGNLLALVYAREYLYAAAHLAAQGYNPTLCNAIFDNIYIALR